MNDLSISISGVYNNSLVVENGDVINLVVQGTPTIPTKLSQLESDSEHRTVTDTQIEIWSGATFDITELPKLTSIGSNTTTTEIKGNEIVDGNFTVIGNTTLDISITGILKASSGLVQKATADTDYLTPNTLVIGNTKTKITYDNKGLVTSGDDATTFDILEATDKRYITDNYRDALSGVANPLSLSNPVIDKQYFDEHTSSGVAYTNSNPVPTTLGGIVAGTTFANQSMTQMFDALLYPYQVPTFSSFSIQGQSTTLEVGASILANRTFTWATTNSSNINSNSISLQDITGSTTIATGLSNTGSYVSTISAITKITATSNTFRVTGINTHSANFTRDYSVSWQWQKYYGESTTTPLVEADIKALRISGLSSGFAGTYSFNAGGYKYLSYCSDLGTATTFKDQSTNLDVAMLGVYIVSVTNSYGITKNYNVHRTLNQIGSSINIIIS